MDAEATWLPRATRLGEELEFFTDLALQETQRWVQAVSRVKFSHPDDLRRSLEDGIILCTLLNRLQPGAVKKINTLPTRLAGLEEEEEEDNLHVFLSVCRDHFGLTQEQLFDAGDLEDLSLRELSNSEDQVAEEHERRLRKVAVTIYWLGRIANDLDIKPPLDVTAFQPLLGSSASRATTAPSLTSPSGLEAATQEDACHSDGVKNYPIPRPRPRQSLLKRRAPAGDELTELANNHDGQEEDMSAAKRAQAEEENDAFKPTRTMQARRKSSTANPLQFIKTGAAEQMAAQAAELQSKVDEVKQQRRDELKEGGGLSLGDWQSSLSGWKSRRKSQSNKLYTHVAVEDEDQKQQMAEAMKRSTKLSNLDDKNVEPMELQQTTEARGLEKRAGSGLLRSFYPVDEQDNDDLFSGISRSSEDAPRHSASSRLTSSDVKSPNSNVFGSESATSPRSSVASATSPRSEDMPSSRAPPPPVARRTGRVVAPEPAQRQTLETAGKTRQNGEGHTIRQYERPTERGKSKRVDDKAASGFGDKKKNFEQWMKDDGEVQTAAKGDTEMRQKIYGEDKRKAVEARRKSFEVAAASDAAGVTPAARHSVAADISKAQSLRAKKLEHEKKISEESASRPASKSRDEMRSHIYGKGSQSQGFHQKRLQHEKKIEEEVTSQSPAPAFKKDTMRSRVYGDDSRGSSSSTFANKRNSFQKEDTPPPPSSSSLEAAKPQHSRSSSSSSLTSSSSKPLRRDFGTGEKEEEEELPPQYEQARRNNDSADFVAPWRKARGSRQIEKTAPVIPEPEVRDLSAKASTSPQVTDNSGERLAVQLSLRPGKDKDFGLTLTGGSDRQQPLTVQHVTRGSPADVSEVRVGDEVLSINRQDVSHHFLTSANFILKEATRSSKVRLDIRRHPDSCGADSGGERNVNNNRWEKQGQENDSQAQEILADLHGIEEDYKADKAGLSRPPPVKSRIPDLEAPSDDSYSDFTTPRAEDRLQETLPSVCVPEEAPPSLPESSYPDLPTEKPPALPSEAAPGLPSEPVPSLDTTDSSESRDYTQLSELPAQSSEKPPAQHPNEQELTPSGVPFEENYSPKSPEQQQLRIEPVSSPEYMNLADATSIPLAASPRQEKVVAYPGSPEHRHVQPEVAEMPEIASASPKSEETPEGSLSDSGPKSPVSSGYHSQDALDMSHSLERPSASSAGWRRSSAERQEVLEEDEVAGQVVDEPAATSPRPSQQAPEVPPSPEEDLPPPPLPNMATLPTLPPRATLDDSFDDVIDHIRPSPSVRITTDWSKGGGPPSLPNVPPAGAPLDFDTSESLLSSLPLPSHFYRATDPKPATPPPQQAVKTEDERSEPPIAASDDRPTKKARDSFIQDTPVSPPPSSSSREAEQRQRLESWNTEQEIRLQPADTEAKAKFEAQAASMQAMYRDDQDRIEKRRQERQQRFEALAKTAPPPVSETAPKSPETSPPPQTTLPSSVESKNEALREKEELLRKEKERLRREQERLEREFERVRREREEATSEAPPPPEVAPPPAEPPVSLPTAPPAEDGDQGEGPKTLFQQLKYEMANPPPPPPTRDEVVAMNRSARPEADLLAFRELHERLHTPSPPPLQEQQRAPVQPVPQLKASITRLETIPVANRPRSPVLVRSQPPAEKKEEQPVKGEARVGMQRLATRGATDVKPMSRDEVLRINRLSLSGPSSKPVLDREPVEETHPRRRYSDGRLLATSPKSLTSPRSPTATSGLTSPKSPAGTSPKHFATSPRSPTRASAPKLTALERLKPGQPSRESDRKGMTDTSTSIVAATRPITRRSVLDRDPVEEYEKTQRRRSWHRPESSVASSAAAQMVRQMEAKPQKRLLSPTDKSATFGGYDGSAHRPPDFAGYRDEDYNQSTSRRSWSSERDVAAATLSLPPASLAESRRSWTGSSPALRDPQLSVVNREVRLAAERTALRGKDPYDPQTHWMVEEAERLRMADQRERQRRQQQPPRTMADVRRGVPASPRSPTSSGGSPRPLSASFSPASSPAARPVVPPPPVDLNAPPRPEDPVMSQSYDPYYNQYADADFAPPPPPPPQALIQSVPSDSLSQYSAELQRQSQRAPTTAGHNSREDPVVPQYPADLSSYSPQPSPGSYSSQPNRSSYSSQPSLASYSSQPSPASYSSQLSPAQPYSSPEWSPAPHYPPESAAPVVPPPPQESRSEASGPGDKAEQTVVSVSGKQRCAHCGHKLGRGAAMVIEHLQLFYHMECFRCCVCHAPLGAGTASGADVRVRVNKLHCSNCYSNDEAGLMFSAV